MLSGSWGEEQGKSAAQRKATVLVRCSYLRHSDYRQLLFYLLANTPGFHLYTLSIPLNPLSPHFFFINYVHILHLANFSRNKTWHHVRRRCPVEVWNPKTSSNAKINYVVRFCCLITLRWLQKSPYIYFVFCLVAWWESSVCIAQSWACFRIW